jgi:hypothetical protein
MRNLIRRALTKHVLVEDAKARKVRVKENPPSELLVLTTMFSIVAIIALTILEIAHITILGAWNMEIFASITGLIGTIAGILIGART